MTIQRLDDVTGDPIRLSATQRELQREAMVLMINAQTQQINTLTERLRSLEAHHKAVEEHYLGFRRLPMLDRLGWVFLGW